MAKTQSPQQFQVFLKKRLTEIKKQYCSTSYYPVILSKDFADEIVEQWNKEDPAEFGDPFELLGCVNRAMESDWLAMQGHYRTPIIKPHYPLY